MLDPAPMQALLLTAKVATVVTLILLLIGTPLAWWLARTDRFWKAPVAAVIALPLAWQSPFPMPRLWPPRGLSFLQPLQKFDTFPRRPHRGVSLMQSPCDGWPLVRSQLGVQRIL